jgi:hypothetical protein
VVVAVAEGVGIDIVTNFPEGSMVSSYPSTSVSSSLSSLE